METKASVGLWRNFAPSKVPAGCDHNARLCCTSMSRYRLSSWASSRRLNCYTLKPFVSDVVCRCRYLPPTQQLQWLTRSFTISPSLAKKGGKAEREEARAQGNASSTEDPYDFSILNKGVDESMSRLTADLDKLRPGGRFNPEVLEAIIVPLGKGSSGQKQKLGSLAQIVPKGRTLTVFVEDKDHVKSITSAILSSNLNLTPQASPDNPNNLLINLPPTTKESRDQAVTTAQKAADAANNGIRNARQAQHKKLRQMQLERKARPDDLKKAGEKMEKAVVDATSKVQIEVEKKKKVLSSA